jgi:hypothetical protein
MLMLVFYLFNLIKRSNEHQNNKLVDDIDPMKLHSKSSTVLILIMFRRTNYIKEYPQF